MNNYSIQHYESMMKPAIYREAGRYAYMEYPGIDISDIDAINVPHTVESSDEITICCVSRDRLAQFTRLSDSLCHISGDRILITQGARYDHPEWSETNIDEPQLLPAYMAMVQHGLSLDKAACNTQNSLSWARNEALSQVETPWVAFFDDDFVCKNATDWIDYYITVQNASKSACVMHSFGAWLLHMPTFRRYLYAIDERYINGSSGCEDEDFFCRWTENRLKMAVGFNKEHTFSSEIRGSSTGYDGIVHMRDTVGGCRSTNHMAFDNQRWHWKKWKMVDESTGIQARPPFKGWLKRQISGDIDWMDYH